VFANLPRSRPQLRSAKRPSRAAAQAVSDPTLPDGVRRPASSGGGDAPVDGEASHRLQSVVRTAVVLADAGIEHGVSAVRGALRLLPGRR
jgi:hypothetical protein